jgi:hypothetical protein
MIGLELNPRFISERKYRFGASCPYTAPNVKGLYLFGNDSYILN